MTVTDSTPEYFTTFYSFRYIYMTYVDVSYMEIC